jgi:shikimate kinase
MTDSSQAPIFLIGYRGTGKTTVARELAARLAYNGIDADDMIEQEAGKTIAQIFTDNGEPAFRDLEVKAVAALCNKSRIVVALGGGAVLREANRLAIAKTGGPVVWLTATVDTILDRIATDSTSSVRRPNLTAGGGREEVERLLAERAPLYRQCATLVVDTEGKSAEEVAGEILKRL